METDDGKFWDRRYREEGAVWGDDPSPTACLASRHVGKGGRVLDIGFGYGRDLAFFIRQGCRVAGIDASAEGCRQAEARLGREGMRADFLVNGRVEDDLLPEGQFDLAISHRVIHLLATPATVEHFVRSAERVLRPGGILCVAARNPRDLRLEDMVHVADGVYEYRERPGHRIRFWDDAAYAEAFGGAFDILSLTPAVEPESVSRPVPCYFTVMIGRKKEGARANGRPLKGESSSTRAEGAPAREP